MATTHDSALSLPAAREVHGQVLDQLSELSDRCAVESRDPTPAEAREMRQLGDRLDTLKARITALQRSALFDSGALGGGGSTRSGSTTRQGRVSVTGEPLVYAPDSPHSWVRDLWASTRQGDFAARERLERHQKQAQVERRDLTSTDGAGGDLVPPLYLDEWLPLSRAGRPFAAIVNNRPLPPNTDTISVPRVLTGSATSAQADLGAVQETDPTTGTLSVPVKTVAGQVDVSRQLLDRSQPGVDEVIFADLRADYNTKIDLQTLTGSGSGANAKGVLSDANRITVTYTDASPTVGEFYAKIQDAAQQIATQRYLPADTVAMHPRRWAWIASASDTTGRPLVVPNASATNSPATIEEVAAEGPVATLAGLRVVVDANLPTNQGAGTNEDVVIVTRASDLYLYELPTPVPKIYEGVLSANLAVRLQLYSYFAFTSERFSKSTASIGGTGLVAPTF